MKPEKAYILKIETPLSEKYATHAAQSCSDNGLPYEFFIGYTESMSMERIWKDLGLKFKKTPTVKGKGGAATASHIGIWKKIRDLKETAIILEHDAVLLHNPDIDIPDNHLVALGYKIKDLKKYDFRKAGPPNKLEVRKKHGGAHAYAINHVTANTLLNDLEQTGLDKMIDNSYFLRLGGKIKDQTTLAITDPICAIGWVRESTIWNKAAVDNYRPILKSFETNYNADLKSMNLKG